MNWRAGKEIHHKKTGCLYGVFQTQSYNPLSELGFLGLKDDKINPLILILTISYNY